MWQLEKRCQRAEEGQRRAATHVWAAGTRATAECQNKARENTIVIPRPQFPRDQVCPCSDLGAIMLPLPKPVPLNPHLTQAGTRLFRHCRGSLLISALGRLCSLSPTLSSSLVPQSLPVGSTLEESLVQRKQEERERVSRGSNSVQTAARTA